MDALRKHQYEHFIMLIKSKRTALKVDTEYINLITKMLLKVVNLFICCKFQFANVSQTIKATDLHSASYFYKNNSQL